MPPIKFSQVNAIEPLDSSRFQVEFPTIQGIDGRSLSLHHTEVTLPNRGIAQIGVKILGNTANFRGNSQNDNILTVGFVESKDAPVTKALFAWFKLCRNSENGTSKLKKEYAQPARVVLYNSKGEVAIAFKVYNMWPMQITMPQLTEASGPVKYEVQFSVDAVSPEGTEGDDQSNAVFNATSLSDRGTSTRDGNVVVSAGNFGFGGGGIGFNGNFGIGGMNAGLGFNSNGINIGAGAKIGPFNLALNANIPLPVNALTLSQFSNTFSSFFGR